MVRRLRRQSAIDGDDQVEEPPTGLPEKRSGENPCKMWVFGSTSESAKAVENGDGGNYSSASSRDLLPHPDPSSSRKSRRYWTPSTKTDIVRAMSDFSDVRTRTRTISTLNLSSVTPSSSTSSPQTDTMLANVSASQAIKGTPHI
ncbi:hypothetical protein GmHk_04G010411 [Glycine max]|nr:hypothetical protein GmHk_04G010411 [Glycine max]